MHPNESQWIPIFALGLGLLLGFTQVFKIVCKREYLKIKDVSSDLKKKIS
jgi:hypothetical protein